MASEKADTGAESPTTARPLEMDDDDVQETGVIGGDDTASKPATPAKTTTSTTPIAASTEEPEVAPPKPPRPLTDQQRNEQTLKEAFPSIDLAVVKAVLRASGGNIDAAFNALLEMTDPDAAQHEQDEQPPPQPPRPAQPQAQLEADEQYARQLAQHYESVGAYEARTSNRGPQQRPHYDEREHSFIEDDLPEIGENLRKGFQETQTKVTKWFTDLRKKIDDEFNNDEDEQSHQRQGGHYNGRPSRNPTRRSGDYDRYDADPELLSDDFAGMRFHADGTPVRTQRQPTNPNLFRPPSVSPKPGSERKVSFRDNVEDIDAYSASPKVPPKDSSGATGNATSGGTPGSGGKTSKWQPLTSMDPSPIAENDPFSLGDSDDEKDHGKSGTIKMEDSEGERLRKATTEAMSDSLVDDKKDADKAGAEAKK